MITHPLPNPLMGNLSLHVNGQGGWEQDETIEEAACRETFEEAGLKGILEVC